MLSAHMLRFMHIVVNSPPAVRAQRCVADGEHMSILTVQALLADRLRGAARFGHALAGLTLLAAFSAGRVLVGQTRLLIGQGPSLQAQQHLERNSHKMTLLAASDAESID